MRKILLIALLFVMPMAVFAQDDVVEIDWNTRGYDLEGETDATFVVSCPEDGEAFSLWGTDVYTDDSSICTVAVHSGLITFEEGGEFVVTILDGLEEYESTEQNGIESSSWGSWSRSIAVSALGNTFISEDGTITLEYPEGWTIEETFDGITITAEDSDVEAEILIIYLIDAIAEQLGVSEDDTAEEAMDSITEAFEENDVAFSNVELMELGDKDVAFANIEMGDDELLIAAIETGEGLLLAELSEDDNDLDAALPYFIAVIESLTVEGDK
ncbi:MAG: LCCL domain-containing protein [Chloroflexota bacterium]